MEKLERPVDHIVDGESQFCHHYFAWRACPEAIQSDDVTGSAYPFEPAKSRARLNCQRRHVEGQN